MRKYNCTCGGFDENFEVADESKVAECGVCGALVCECGLDEFGQVHEHTEEDFLWGYPPLPTRYRR